ncbi:MAG: adenylyl-sulfate kinase [Bacteroidota bacterium]
MADNLHPIFDSILQTRQKEVLLNQQSLVIWMVGLSGSGKSTLARALENSLHESGRLTALLDGDNLRSGINSNLTFSPEDRLENIRRAAETAKLLSDNGVITICSLISPTEEVRSLARNIIGPRYVEIFIDCPLEVCEKRDVKGLYAKARQGLIPDFTGVSAPFEPAINADLIVNTSKSSVAEGLTQLDHFIKPKLLLN